MDTTKPVLLAKAGESGRNGCPGYWIAGDQVITLGPQRHTGDLDNVLPGEVACTVDASVILRAADKLREMGYQ